MGRRLQDNIMINHKIYGVEQLGKKDYNENNITMLKD